MRCRNCHTVMMETDLECPTCHSSVERATAAAPGPFNDNKPGLGLLLPMFGGAIGGAIYGAIKVAEASSNPAGTTSTWGTVQRPASPSANHSAKPVKWFFAIVFMLLGGLFLLVAVVNFFDTWKVSRWEPKEVTAADLRKAMDSKKSPGPWIACTFDESKPTNLIVTRQRIGRRGEVKSPCLLVRVEDKWLIATVAPGFEGNQLVGRLVPLESQQVMDRIRKIEPTANLLPYEFNAVDGSASDLQTQFIAVGVLAFFGLAGLWLGVWMVRGRRQPQS
ncbi:MAG TPA: hypothetical protein VKE98_21760 [Gemmataceae bacterium]|nr:hypothetical protein [Gemmataceae bacterium]